MCNRLLLTPSRSTPYHPQGKAKVERINRTLEDGLAKYWEERHLVWSVHLQSFMVAYRSAVHESNGQSIVFREKCACPSISNVRRCHPTCWSQRLRFPALSRSFFNIWVSNWERLLGNAATKSHFRQKRSPSYKEGDLVLIHSPIFTQGQTPKLKSFCSGPHCITKVIK